MRILLLFVIFGLLSGCSSSKKSDIQDISDPIVISCVDSTINLAIFLNEYDLNKISRSKLRLLRNEIFARKGYKFDANDLELYFRNQRWYSPILDNETALTRLTKCDSANISLIKTIEAKREQIYSSLTYKDYVDFIPDLILPLEFNCTDWSVPDLDYENDTLLKFRPEGATIIGKLYETESEIAFIYGYPADIFYPIVKYYSWDNVELHEKRLYALSECIEDMDYKSITIGTIQSDFIVQLETLTIKCDEINGVTECDTMAVSNTMYL